MTELYLTDSAHDAAVHLLANTPLGSTLGIDSARTEGSALVLTIDAMRYEMLSSGERALLGILEMFANVRSTVTLHQLARLDDDCRAALVEAYRIYLRVPAEDVAAWSALGTRTMLAAIFLVVGWMLWEFAHPLTDDRPTSDERYADQPPTRELTDAELYLARRGLYAAEQEAATRRTLEHLAFVERTGWRAER